MKQSPTNNSHNRCDIMLAVDAYLPWSGGSRIYYDNLYRRLAEQHGLAIQVETSHCAGDLEYDLAHASSPLQIMRHGDKLHDWKLKRVPTLLRKSARIIRTAMARRPAAVHCGDLFPQDLAGLWLRRQHGVPLLVFVHGDEVSQTEGRRLQPRVRNAIYRSADAIVAANTFAYERVAAICNSTQRLSLITPGVDTAAFHPGERPGWIERRYELGNSPVIVTVGRLVKKKGHETVLRSLPAVLRQIPDAKYLVVGGGPEESRLKQVVQELGLGHSVRFTGDIPHHALADFYRAGDLFCMVNQQDATGDIESFGMVVIEAGACGKPVIAGRSGGTAESVIEGQTGLLCDPGNHAALSEMLLLLLANPGLGNRMGSAGLERARRDFNWDSRARQLLAVHNHISGFNRAPALERQAC
jgi:phosphatidylinositol alpha-1,6-mannosyltransferase